MRLTSARAAALYWRMGQQPFNTALLVQGATLEKEWQTEQQRVDVVRRELARLQFRAPFAGRVGDAGP